MSRTIYLLLTNIHYGFNFILILKKCQKTCQTCDVSGCLTCFLTCFQNLNKIKTTVIVIKEHSVNI